VATYADANAQVAFYERLLPRLRDLPGVTANTAMTGMPPRRDVNANDTEFEGLQPTPGGPAHNVEYYQTIHRDYLETMQIPLVAGRAFSTTDEGGAPVVMINERLAKVFYPGMNPIGRRIRPCCQGSTPPVPWFNVIGIVKDGKQGGLEEETGTELYFYYPQSGGTRGFAPRSMNIVVRTTGDPMALANGVRSIVRELDASLPLANMASMEDVLHGAVARPRFLTLLLGVFAAVALALAAIGTYGVMAYSVAERRKEIGIRMALGAQAGGVLRMVLLQGLGVAAIGLALGIAGSLALSELLESMLFNVSTIDPVAFAGAPALLALVALLACYLPARRATTVDPIRVLKQE
jgi:predicted permease